MQKLDRRLALVGLLSVLLLACSNIRLFGGGGQAPSGAGGLQVQVPLNQVFYGQTTCGPTSLPVNIQVSSQQTVTQVGVQYRLVSGQAGAWQQVSAKSAGGGLYLALVPLSAEAEAFFQGQAGRIEFRAYAADAQGKLLTYPADKVLQVPVQPCQKQAIQTSQDKAPPQVINLFTSAAPVYYRGTCTPNTLTVTAVVVDDSGAPQVQLEYWFQRNGQKIGQPRRLPMQGQGTVFQVTVPVGQEAAAALQGQEGQLGFRVVASDAAGHQTSYPDTGAPAWTVAVQSCGSSSGSGGASAPSSSGQTGQQSGGSTATGPSTGTGNSGTSLTIQRVQAYPDTAYYGTCTNGETTWVDIEVVVNDVQRVASARVRYHYELSSVPGNDFSLTQPMYRQQGIGNYTARIEVGQELASDAAVDRLAYYVEITTTDGRTVTSTPQRFPLTPCASSGSSSSGSSAGGSSAGGSMPEVRSVTVRPDPAYAGAACEGAGQPTLLEVEAEIVPATEVQQARVVLGFLPTPNVAPQYVGEVNMSYVSGNTFAAGVDLNTWYGNTTPPDGLLAITVLFDSPAGSGQSAPTFVTLHPCSAPPPIITTFAVWPNPVVEGESYILEWETQLATCGVYLDGQLVADSGTLTLTAPSIEADQQITHTLEAHGGSCDAPTVTTETVMITVVNQANALRLSSNEMLSPGESYDLDMDGTPDFSLMADAQGMSLMQANGAEFIVLESTAVVGDRTSDLEECRARFIYGDPTTQRVDVTPDLTTTLICVWTGAGRVGYLSLDNVTFDSGQPDQSWIGFSVYSEIP